MTDVVSEMVARVWRLDVRVGQRVSKGDTLMILESMKMEIPVLSPVGGVVSELRVEEGVDVGEGDVIAVLA